MILLDEFVYIIYGRHLDSSFPSIPWDHLTLFTVVRGRGILRTSLVEIQKPHILKKVRFGGAPLLDREYAATVTHKEGSDEHSVRTLRRGYSSTNIRAGS